MSHSMKPLVTPIVNLNGSSAEHLINERLSIMTKIDELIVTLQHAMPHGRDYQTHSTAFACEDARKAWSERIQILREIRSDFVADAIAIQHQEQDRRRA